MSGIQNETDFLETLNGQADPPNEREENAVQRLDKYWLRDTEFKDKLRLWRKDVSRENPNNKDLLMYLKSTRQEKIDQTKKEISKFGS